jgi:hypothetical protein
VLGWRLCSAGMSEEDIDTAPVPSYAGWISFVVSAFRQGRGCREPHPLQARPSMNQFSHLCGATVCDGKGRIAGTLAASGQVAAADLFARFSDSRMSNV